jgi:hypothetical protein
MAERGWITVQYYNCACEWVSKYCDENHRAVANIPLSVLRKYSTK